MHSATIHTVIGFDFGMRKIGIAVGQSVTKTASPLAKLNAQDGIPNWAHVGTLIKAWQPDALVVGLPLNMDGTTQDITFAAQKFSRRLKAFYRLPVFMMDERLTTKSAQSHFDKQAHKKADLDSLAAVIIVESWLREPTHD